MKNLSVIIVLALAAAFLFSGCTMTETPSERFSRITASQELNFRMMMEDIDSVLMLNRPSHSTPWAIETSQP